MQQERLNQYFRFRCDKGLRSRGLSSNQAYQDRLAFEIATIEKMGFPGYLLIVADFIWWARQHNIPVGPGRGSAAGSLVAYALEITDIDPIKYGLLFERFLNPDRISMPDIDVDFCEDRRDEVIEYVTNKYGKDRVAQIGTFGTMKAKGAIRDVCRTLGYPISTGDKLAKLIPPPVHGKPVPLQKAIDTVPELAVYSAAKGTPEAEILQNALKLENTVRSYGIHASGVVIADRELWKLVPLATGKDGNQATQFEMNNVEAAGLIKFDFLGLRALTMIDTCVALIEKHHGVKINPREIPLDDPDTFAQLQKGDTCGIFQLEASSGIRDLLSKIIPTDLEDIIALVAMYRPGPLKSEGLKMYLNVRAGRGEPTYPFPILEPILKPTSGWIIYQEQVMQIAQALCGYTKGMADDLRKAIGKKKEDEMKKHRGLFVGGAVKQGVDEAKVTHLYDQIESFGAYGFNKSHAAAYGKITYQTAWLKTHYPVEFMCASLSCDYGNPAKVIKYITECKRIGVKVLPPSVNESGSAFTIVEPTGKGVGCLGSIRFGLAAVKNLGEEPVSHILGAKREGYRDLIDFCERVDLGKINRKKLESLVLGGAFDSNGVTRTSLLSTIDRVWDYRDERKRFEAKNETFKKRLVAFEEREAAIKQAELDGVKKKPAKLKVPEKPEEPKMPTIVSVPEMDSESLLAYEKELLGFYISGHPLDAYQSMLNMDNMADIESLFETEGGEPVFHDGQKVRIAGIVSSLQEKQTKKGDTMAFATFEDKTGQVDVVFFGGVYAKFKALLKSTKPLVLYGELEVNEPADDGGDPEDEKVMSVQVKMKPFDVKELSSGEIRYEPIDVMIQPQQAEDLLELMSKYKGDSCQVNVLMKTVDNSTFKVGRVFSIGGNRGAFLRDLGRVLN